MVDAHRTTTIRGNDRSSIRVMTGRMSSRIRKLAAFAIALMLPCASCNKEAAVDTTKEISSDDEAPKFQEQILNGERKLVPWEEVPKASRYFFQIGRDGGFEYRVPIVRVEIMSLDQDGKPVPPEQGWRVEYTEYGLNPKHVSHSYAGKDH